MAVEHLKLVPVLLSFFLNNINWICFWNVQKLLSIGFLEESEYIVKERKMKRSFDSEYKLITCSDESENFNEETDTE